MSLVSLLASRALADVQPGDLVTRANADAVANLVSPGVMWCLRHGMQMTIAANRHIELNEAYRIATEKYSGQTRLSADGISRRLRERE